MLFCEPRKRYISEFHDMTDLHKKALVSFEVKSLFTNIPFDFTIQVILEILFSDS